MLTGLLIIVWDVTVFAVLWNSGVLLINKSTLIKCIKELEIHHILEDMYHEEDLAYICLP